MITMMFPMTIVASNIYFGNKKTTIQINVKVLLHIFGNGLSFHIFQYSYRVKNILAM